MNYNDRSSFSTSHAERCSTFFQMAWTRTSISAAKIVLSFRQKSLCDAIMDRVALAESAPERIPTELDQRMRGVYGSVEDRQCDWMNWPPVLNSLNTPEVGSRCVTFWER
jgi:hypothetical protein